MAQEPLPRATTLLGIDQSGCSSLLDGGTELEVPVPPARDLLKALPRDSGWVRIKTEQLFRLTSDVISLRERVAQAEFAARIRELFVRDGGWRGQLQARNRTEKRHTRELTSMAKKAASENLSR